MTTAAAEVIPLSVLYEQDETAWLEIMSALAAQGRFSEMDHANLSEYLSDMAKRDRREVVSRLVVLLTHLLKWEYQPERRSGSWRGSIMEQRRELGEVLDSRTLLNHALAVLPKAYANAAKQAAAETSLPRATFPQECAWDVGRLLADEETADTDAAPEQGA